METKITRDEAFKFCKDRMYDLHRGKHTARKHHCHHFGKIDIGDLLDLIYGKRANERKKEG